MYLARFEYETLCLRTAAIGFSSARRDAAHGLARVLAPYPRVDAALRVTASRAATHRLLLLCAPDDYRAELQACHADVLRSLPLADVWLPADGGEFDVLSGVRTRHQLRVNHEGYRHGGLTLGCDFKLYAALGNDLPAASISYQVNLRTHRPNAETERRVLKYLARLDLERPFTDSVRMMQRTLAERLRQPGWVGDEYLAADDPRDLERRLQRMRAFFAETTGRIGFNQLPLESGEYPDPMLTGAHGAAASDSVATEGARLFSAHEVDWLCAGGFFDGSARGSAAPGRGAASVFISYASADHHAAAAICAQLEAQGVSCWIAPRDIDSDVLPYTQAIERGIGQARAVVVLISAVANLSVHIPRELDLALAGKLAVVPVRLESVEPSGQLNYLLRTCQWLDAFDGDLVSAGRRLRERFARLIP